ncbi:MAG: 2-dehydropantoate 2-reductase [Saprospiraceae bacterium]|nr:2-dehydropantoate 2-reductase [Saprospiraceae bacterium]
MQDRLIHKIGIIGLGPVGSILAVHFKESGFKVAICDNDKIKLNLIKKDGIILTGVLSKKISFEYVYSSLSEMESFQAELYVICVKATQLPELMNTLCNVSDSSFLVLCAMNGIDVEQIISDKIGETRTLRMVINFAGNLVEPNVTKVTFFNPPNYIASIDDSKQEVADSVAKSLTFISLETKSIGSFEMLRRIWEKTILNSSLSAICALGRMTIQEAMQNSDTVELIEQVIEEALEVAEAEKIKFDDDFTRKCLRYLYKAGNHFPSLAVDLLNNRPTEIDYMNGKIVEYGRKHYVRTSLNLTFTNMIKAVSNKNVIQKVQVAKSAVNMNQWGKSLLKINSDSQSSHYFLGVDLGSAYTKFTIIDEKEQIKFQTALKTLNRDRISIRHVMEVLKSEFVIEHICATGYGRKHLMDADLVKTELNCATLGVSKYFTGAKNIIDIGGEDIKVIKCNKSDALENFYLNDKCAAGTGSFISEVAERAEINISEMSDLASKSNFNKELNSFCTVFAKTEIMTWLFDGLPVEDISKGIYLSILNRIIKLKIDPQVDIYLIGGVISHHPYLRVLLQEKFQKKVHIVDRPQFVVSFGAALYAKHHWLLPKYSKEIEPESFLKSDHERVS